MSSIRTRFKAGDRIYHKYEKMYGTLLQCRRVGFKYTFVVKLEPSGKIVKLNNLDYWIKAIEM